jgi:hydrogenase expression/formation protein HypC
MCLAAPYTLKEIFADGSARAVFGGVEADIRRGLHEGPKPLGPGDPVLVHAGFAIPRLDKGESEELIALWNEINKAAETAASHA